MRNVVLIAVLGLAMAGGATRTQSTAAGAPASTPQEQPAPRPGDVDALGDLEKMTFACARAGLNAAAREAAKYPSQGAYQFSYFNIVSNSHHAAYEVHFKSNYATEPVLKYCVAIYCQQGFDPATSKTNVTLMGTGAAAHAAGTGHAVNACSQPGTPARRRTTR